MKCINKGLEELRGLVIIVIVIVVGDSNIEREKCFVVRAFCILDLQLV
jgi:hypothetical protein